MVTSKNWKKNKNKLKETLIGGTYGKNLPW
jgi:hypothetical protein